MTLAQRAHPEWPPVVVAGASLTGVRLMRNLSRRGVGGYYVECEPRAPGFRSVYGRALLCPNPDSDPAGWAGFMVDFAGTLKRRPVLIASADQFVSAIARHASCLAGHFLFCDAGVAAQALLATKQRQYAIAGSGGLPVPRTKFVTCESDLAAFAGDAVFPCLLKPLHVREWERLPAGHELRGEKLTVAARPAELLSAYRRIADYAPEAVVQEVIEGPDWDKFCYMSCYSKDGRRLAHCMVRQLRTRPIYFGSASVVEPTVERELAETCDQFLRSIGYAGLCEIELKRDRRDGVVKMIEANPRYTVTSDAAPYMGVDLGWIHFLDLAGQPVEEVFPTGNNFRHVVLRRDFGTFRSYRRERLLSWGDLLSSYRPPVHFFDLDLRDWRLALDTVAALARILFYPWYHRLTAHRHARDGGTPASADGPDRV